MIGQSKHIAINNFLWLALFLSLLVSLKLNGIVVLLLLIHWFLEGGIKGKLKKLKSQPILYTGIILFGVLSLRALFTEDFSQNFHVVERKSVLILLPLLALSKKAMDKESADTFIKVLGIGTLLSLIYCLIMAIIRYIEIRQGSVFFYHELSSSLKLHAVYYSVFMLSVFILSYSLKDLLYKRFIQIGLFFGILLLSSKLIISLTILLLVVKLFASVRNRNFKVSFGLLLCALLTLGLTYSNPITNRFKDISPDRLQFVSQDKIGQDVYLDGLSLRLLQLRFGFEILNDQQAWLFGVGQLEAQNLLDKKYIEADLYAPTSGEDHGFLGYNFHNQYLQTIVQGGVIAFVPLITLFFLFLGEAYKKKNFTLFAITLLFALFSCTESVFERQMGVVSFLAFSLFSLGQYRELGSGLFSTKINEHQ